MKHFLKFGLLLVVGFTLLFSCKKDRYSEEEPDPYNDRGVIVGGLCWSTRNLESHGRFTARPEHFGGYFQWGRIGDGHENPNSATITTLSNTDIPPHGYFIISMEEPYDWRFPQNDNLWGTIKTDFDPCPCGWRIPTMNETITLFTSWDDRSWGELHGVSGLFLVKGINTLFFPAAGSRNGNGSIHDVGEYGRYWNSTSHGTFGQDLTFSSLSSGGGGRYRVNGLTVRCVKDLEKDEE
jgi:uncharacterized protein (TIGR02145 family)